MRDPAYGLYTLSLLENLAYGVATLVVACLWFARREVRIKS